MYLKPIGMDAPRLSREGRKSHAERSFGSHYLQRFPAGYGSYISLRYLAIHLSSISTALLRSNSERICHSKVRLKGLTQFRVFQQHNLPVRRAFTDIFQTPVVKFVVKGPKEEFSALRVIEIDHSNLFKTGER